MDEVQHFSHEHALKRIPFPTSTMEWHWLFWNTSCNLCNCGYLHGEKAVYRCSKCSSLIHQSCAEMPIRMYFHPLHALDHPLILNKRSLPATTRCYYCDKSFKNDECYTYGCDECSDFYMHMACAAIPLPTLQMQSHSDDVGGDRRVARFNCHLHPMSLVLDSSDERHQGGECFACQSPWSGPAYCCASKDEDCEIFLHKSCAELPERVQHPLDSCHFELQVSEPRYCKICDRVGCRLIYCCKKDGCKINLCVKCAFLMTVKCLSHDHVLWLVDKPWDIHCEGCQRSYQNWVDLCSTAEVNSTRCSVFRCLICDFYLHFLCGPLPTSVKYEFHIHRLTLVDHSSTKDDSDECYCDVCEQERDPFFRVYYCKECKYVAHIHCIISEIMKEIKGFTKDVEFRALGESRWEFGIEIYEEKHDDPTEHLKMSDIMDRLTEKERKILLDPFGCHDPKYSSHREASHDRYRELNSRFDRHGISIEDIGRIRQFFRFGPDEFTNFRHELHLFTPFEGLKIDDKYLRQKVEDVDGYMVPTTLVPILKTLLHKNKDLGGKSNLTPNMKSVTSTLLCIVIDKMCRTMVESITKDDFKGWYFYLDAIKTISGFEIIELDSFDNFLLPSFLGFEVTRHEKEIGEKLDLKIERLQGNLKRREEIREKFNSYASAKSDFIKECASNAAEWKRKFLGDKWF